MKVKHVKWNLFAFGIVLIGALGLLLSQFSKQKVQNAPSVPINVSNSESDEGIVPRQKNEIVERGVISRGPLQSRDQIDLSDLEFTPDNTFSHLKLIPHYDEVPAKGVEVFLDSSEYSLEDFGFIHGDLITHIEDETILDDSGDFIKVIQKYIQQETILVTINRNNEILLLELELN